jgi:hypothetical protein
MYVVAGCFLIHSYYCVSYSMHIPKLIPLLMDIWEVSTLRLLVIGYAMPKYGTLAFEKTAEAKKNVSDLPLDLSGNKIQLTLT